jgi:hypothetical protein
MGSSLKYWVSFSLTILATMVMTLVAAVRQGSAFKDRTLLREFRFYFHLMLPYISIVCLLNVGWHFALVTIIVWILGLAFTPFYVYHVEHLAERTRNIDAARKGLAPVMYLRSFAAADAMPRPMIAILRCLSHWFTCLIFRAGGNKAGGVVGPLPRLPSSTRRPPEKNPSKAPAPFLRTSHGGQLEVETR